MYVDDERKIVMIGSHRPSPTFPSKWLRDISGDSGVKQFVASIVKVVEATMRGLQAALGHLWPMVYKGSPLYQWHVFELGKLNCNFTRNASSPKISHIRGGKQWSCSVEIDALHYI